MNRTLLAALVAATAPAWAQQTIQQVVITGNPYRDANVATPASVLQGGALVLRRGASLGETLDGLPGVSATYFGPNASRPVLRGQDGDRIRVLNNTGAAMDASSLSFDHAVPIDPLVVQRIEVLRGPAALAYGGSAVGGVVNVIDNRIPSLPLSGQAGAAEVRLGGAAAQRAASAWVETGGRGVVLHADGFTRRTEDTRVPAFDVERDDGGSERRRRIQNSASQASGGAVGASWVTSHGHLGASIDSYRNNYGIVVEEDVQVRMQRDRLASAGELRLDSGFFTTLRAQAAVTEYQHREVEADGAVGTVFKNRGTDARLELVHRALPLAGGRLEGAWGLQGESSRFSALGEEAFVPNTHTRQAAAYATERWSWGQQAGVHGNVSAGVRAERVEVQSSGDAGTDQQQFGAARERAFSPSSSSLAAVLNLGPTWQATATLSSTQRAPTFYELYANGVHVATGAFERGDPAQALERARQVDVALAWRHRGNLIKVSAFASRFSNYLLLAATEEPDFVDEEGNGLPVYSFRGVRAQLRGLELEALVQLSPTLHALELDFKLDALRGRDLSMAQALPRLAPSRLAIGLNWKQGAWTHRAELQHAAAQTRVPVNDETTPRWTMVNLSTGLAWKLGPSDALFFAKLQNLGNTLAYNASTPATLRAKAPLPGRSASVGLQLTL